jgi:hypothetical protein
VKNWADFVHTFHQATHKPLCTFCCMQDTVLV